MAKKSVIARNVRRIEHVKCAAGRREELKKVIYNRELPFDERFTAQLKLAAMSRDSSSTRIRNRCLITGRGRGCYRNLAISRIMLRELASQGLIPGMTKSSW